MKGGERYQTKNIDIAVQGSDDNSLASENPTVLFRNAKAENWHTSWLIDF